MSSCGNIQSGGGEGTLDCLYFVIVKIFATWPSCTLGSAINVYILLSDKVCKLLIDNFDTFKWIKELLITRF